MPIRVRTFFRLMKEAVNEFMSDNVVKLSASLAYYTVFSIGPLLLFIISMTGVFFERDMITGKIYWQMQMLVGTDGAKQLISIIDNIQKENNAAKFSIIGFVILLFGATGVFADIQDSINYIWSVRAKPKKGWLKFLRNRLLSFSLIVGMGFLMIVSLLVNTLTDLFTDHLQRIFEDTAVIIFQVLNILILYTIISCLFAVIYKVLPDAKIRWKDALVGASITGIFFILGKFLISFYLANSQLSATYGTAASIIIILSWVYYTSIILYFGAEFTKVYALTEGGGIEPYETAVFIIKREAKELPNSSGSEN